MNRLTVETMPPLPLSMDALVMRHGPWRVLSAAVSGAWRSAAIRREIAEMSPHMRRDIGLEGDAPRRPILEIVR